MTFANGVWKLEKLHTSYYTPSAGVVYGGKYVLYVPTALVSTYHMSVHLYLYICTSVRASSKVIEVIEDHVNNR